MNYAAARPRIRDCDLILFGGRSPVSLVIRAASRSPWSHVGIAYWAGDVLLLLESAAKPDRPDWFRGGRPAAGVRAVALSGRVPTYRGRVAWLPIEGPRPRELRAALENSRRMLSGIPYERDPGELIRAGFGTAETDPRRRRLGSVFCSEIAAAILQGLGILAEDRPPHAYAPGTFPAGAVWRAPYRPAELTILA